MPANSKVSEAMAAPSASDLSLTHAMRGSMVGFARTKVPKPQSVPAMTFSRPTTSA